MEKFLQFLLIAFLYLTSSWINAQQQHHKKYDSQDTVTIEASKLKPRVLGQRSKHLLVAMTDYYFQPSVVLFRSAGKLKCITPDGEQGQCTSFKECYPILFSFDEPGKTRHSVLRDDLLATMTPCFSGKPETPTPKIRQDDDRKEDEIICCTTIPVESESEILKPSKISGGGGGVNNFPSVGNGGDDEELPVIPPPAGGGGGGNEDYTPPSFPGVNIWSQNIVGNRPPIIKVNGTTVNGPVGGSGGEGAVDQGVLVSSNCGVTKVVVPQNAAVAPRKGYPWMAALINSRGMQFCGGSLIDNLHVLTAQHCTTPYKKPEHVAKMQVYLGSFNVQMSGEVGRVTRKVSKIIKHAGYSERTYEHDIAILKLDQPVPFTDYIQPLCLNMETGYDDGKHNATLAGWGRTSNYGGPSPTLRHGTMRVWTNEECQKRYNQYVGFQQIPKIKSTMVCAGNPGMGFTSPVDACQGDSGGPLFMQKGSLLPYTQVGIVSWGIGCGQYPGVYTKVNEYNSWINKNRGLSQQSSMKKP